MSAESHTPNMPMESHTSQQAGLFRALPVLQGQDNHCPRASCKAPAQSQCLSWDSAPHGCASPRPWDWGRQPCPRLGTMEYPP